VADQIERALRDEGARELERAGSSICFIGSSAWPWSPPSRLFVVARGEVDVVPQRAGGEWVRVRFACRTTRGIGVLAALTTAIELSGRLLGGPRFPPLLFPGIIAGLWVIHYVEAWIRIPLLLMRAAAGELEQGGAPAAPGRRRDAAT
jgi:hypothetical protein